MSLDPQSAAEKAVSVLGFGYDFCLDIRLAYCKPGPDGSRLIELDSSLKKDLVVPGGIVVPGVPASIKCDKGERTRFWSDVLSFNQMSEQFNQEMSLTGKIPSGHFNTMFDFRGSWHKDASSTKSLAFDGWFITLYSVELPRSQIALSEFVKQEVPSSWDPAALAEFIDKYGTHVIVGVKMGGKDVIHMKQQFNSNLASTDVQKLLKQLADKKFTEEINEKSMSNTETLAGKLKEEDLMPWDQYASYVNSVRPPSISHYKNDDIYSVHILRGGKDIRQSHKQWLSTVSQSPDVIGMSFIPITSLLSGVQGSGFLIHAMNLYLRYKPPLEELQQFLDFQLPRQWAPMYGDLPLGILRKKVAYPALQFSLMGPKLYINTTQVDSASRPVTGLRLYLEGNKANRLAIHLQHLSTVPSTLQLSDDHNHNPAYELPDRGFLEPVKWSILSHVCTAPVQYNGAWSDYSASIVTKAWFEVKMVGMKKVLFLRLGYSAVASSKIRRSEWVGPSSSSQKSGMLSILISTRFSSGLANPPEKPVLHLNSAVYPGGPPEPARVPKMANFVETKEMVRGPEDLPGCWMVTGAKLCVEGGRISVKVKYSLLTIMGEDSMQM